MQEEEIYLNVRLNFDVSSCGERKRGKTGRIVIQCGVFTNFKIKEREREREREKER